MIAYLRGQIQDKDSDSVVVDVHGVGYRVFLSANSMGTLPAVGSPASLRIHTQVREDAITLYGFSSPEEEELFHHLVTVSGVGPKLAVNILSGMPPAELAAAVAGGDLARLTKISGVGKKTAERLVVELKDKLKVSSILMSRANAAAPAAGDDLVSALANLGYRPADAERAAAAARERHPGADIQDLVRAALQMLASKAV